MRLLALSLILSSCFSARGRAVSFAAGEIAIACDWAMTAWMADHYGDGYRELNPVLGKYPTQGVIAGAIGSALIVNALIYVAPKSIVPDWFKAGWLPWVAIVETSNDLVFNPAPHRMCAP